MCPDPGSGNLGEREHRVDRVEDLGRGHDLVGAPGAGGVERHELDEAHTHATLAAVGGEVDDLVVVDAAHDHAVDLHRVEAGVERGVDPGQDPVQVVAAGERQEHVGSERVERDVDPPQPCRGKVVGHLGQLHAVRGHRDVDLERGEHGDQTRKMRAERGLASGDTHRIEAVALDADPDDLRLLLVGEELLPGQPLHAFGRHAVRAAEVAAVGDGDAQIGDPTPEWIDQWLHTPQGMRHPTHFTGPWLDLHHSLWLTSPQ